ncbi:MAG: NADH:flavin oxidoreductase [Planctomycetes bacterium]|nr:NADH:flavin oxidoreductase [Planctomycetota bacterium]
MSDAGRVRHEIPATRWPTTAEARRAQLFTPARIGAVELRARSWVPAMVPWRATEDGFATDAVVAWYRRFAEGWPAVLVVEATGIRDVPSGPLLRIGDDRFVPGLRRIVDAVREASGGRTRLLIQLIDFLSIRRRPTREAFLGRYLRIGDHHRAACAARGLCSSRADEAAIRTVLSGLDDGALREVLTAREWRDLAFGQREQVDDVHLPHVADLPRTLPGLFASAALRARAAGFDGVELHYAHAYTMASFLSRTNERTDGYGGSPAARVRLPIEVLCAVREALASMREAPGPVRGFCVGARLLGSEAIEGGSTIDDAVYYARELARAGCEFVSVSKGGKFDDAKQPKIGEAAYPYTGPSGHECMPTVRSDERGPFGRNLHLAAAIRGAIRADGMTVPVVGAGGIGTFELAEAALREGMCDLVGAARQSLADPDWWRKVELGRGEEVRRCIYTNYCEGLDQKHKQVTCQLWDRQLAPDGDVSLSHDGKRRLVAPPWEPAPV